jgi:hypothetical protein
VSTSLNILPPALPFPRERRSRTEKKQDREEAGQRRSGTEKKRDREEEGQRRRRTEKKQVLHCLALLEEDWATYANDIAGRLQTGLTRVTPPGPRSYEEELDRGP